MIADLQLACTKMEMVLVIAGKERDEAEGVPTEDVLRAELSALMAQGVKAKAAAQIVAEKYHMKKNQVYPYTIAEEPKGE